jgi:hypothetical protein
MSDYIMRTTFSEGYRVSTDNRVLYWQQAEPIPDPIPWPDCHLDCWRRERDAFPADDHARWREWQHADPCGHTLPSPCGYCDKGKATMECPDCRGDGAVDCPHCRHEMDCEKCKGSGEVPTKHQCEHCNGTGMLPGRPVYAMGSVWLAGYVLFVLACVGWALHARAQRRMIADEMRRVSDERNRLQNHAAGAKFHSSDHKLS